MPAISKEIEEAYDEDFGFIEYENREQKLEAIAEDIHLLELDEENEIRIAQHKGSANKSSKKKTTTTRRKKKTNENNDGKPKIPLKLKRIFRYTDPQMGFPVIQQALAQNEEFMALTSDKLTGNINEDKPLLLRRLNIYLDAIHDWSKTVFPDLSFEEALGFMESQSFNARVTQAIDSARQESSIRYKKAVEKKEQRKKRKRKTNNNTVNNTEKLLDNSAKEDNQEEEEEKENEDMVLSPANSSPSPSPYKTNEDQKPIRNVSNTISPVAPMRSYSLEDGEEEFQFEETSEPEDNQEQEENKEQDEEKEQKEEEVENTPIRKRRKSKITPSKELQQSVEI
ncbi:hypothetical protein ABK040_002975 [Willaertia magna]